MRSLYDRPSILMLLVALFWSVNFVIGRAIAGYIPPVSLASLRWILAFCFFLPFALPHLKKDWPVIRQHMPTLLFLGVIGPGCYNTITYVGLGYTEAINGLVLNSSAPIFIAITAWLLFRDPISSMQATGMVVAFAGVMVIVTKGHPESLANFRFNFGDLLLITAMLTWSIYTAYLRKRPVIAWQSFAGLTYFIAGFGNLPLAFIEVAQGKTIPFELAAIAVVLYVAIFPSLLAYVFYNRGVELLGPTRSGFYLFLIPVFGGILATIFLGERLYPFHLIGFALIIGGVAAGTFTSMRVKPDPEGAPVMPLRPTPSAK
jgi:drug/metabolite transporter (DMT)-like permease